MKDSDMTDNDTKVERWFDCSNLLMTNPFFYWDGQQGWWYDRTRTLREKSALHVDIVARNAATEITGYPPIDDGF